MKFAFILLLFPLAALGSKLTKEENVILQRHCGKPVPVPVRRSQHTRQVARSEAPWIARIDILRKKWFPGISLSMRDLHGASGTCSGTLISPRHVITAAHCLGNFKSTCYDDGTLKSGDYTATNLGRFSVRFLESCEEGECDHAKEFKEIHVEVSKAFVAQAYTGFRCHKDYLPEGDTAVFELAEDVPFSEQLYPACLNENPLKLDDELVLFGYGVNGTDDTTRALRKLETSVINCTKAYHKPMEDSLCDSHKINGICNGDSGGGKMVFDRRGTALVAGIVSGFYGNCEKHLAKQKKHPFTSISFNTRVDKQLFWICAATGICANDDISRTVAEYEQRGLTGDWYRTILPRSGFDLYI